MRWIPMRASIVLSALLALAACSAAPTGGVQPPATRDAPPAATPATPAAIAPVAPAPVEPARPVVRGVPELDRTCRVDSDCVVKDVGSCCGYSPACVNSAARPDPEAVQAACADSGMAGVCGFREIDACACVSNTCEPARAGGAVAR